MKKLKLDVDAIAVETFATEPRAPQLGTVRGLETNVTEFGCCRWSIDGGAYCTYDCGGGTNNPQCSTAAVTCEYGPTMNPLDANCLDATMAGSTCNGAETCYDTCPY
jgi:hypothetical protein